MLNIFQDKTINENIDVEKFQKLLHTETGEVLWKLFKMYCLNENKDYTSSLEKGENIISDFLKNLYNSYLQENKIKKPELEDFNYFLEYLATNELLPFSKRDLQKYLRKTKELTSDSGNIEKRAIDLYDLITEFHARLSLFQSK